MCLHLECGFPVMTHEWKTVWHHSESITPVTQHTTDFGHNHKKAPASASQMKFGHLNIKRTEQPTDKHAKQLTIVLAENLQEDLNDSIMSSRYVRVYKNRALADIHRTENISNDELKLIIPIYFVQ